MERFRVYDVIDNNPNTNWGEKAKKFGTLSDMGNTRVIPSKKMTIE